MAVQGTPWPLRWFGLMALSSATSGTPLVVRGRELEYSRWAMRRSNRRWGLNSRLFATDPWPVIRRAVQGSRASRAARDAALAFLGQARAYFVGASDAELAEAKPVMLYYSFLNLAKALVLSRRQRSNLDNARHGLAERLPAGGVPLIDGYLNAHPATPSDDNLFDLLWRTLGGAGIATPTRFDLKRLLPQIVPGHRLWTSAGQEDERFVAVEAIRFLEDKHSGCIWLTLDIKAGDLARLSVTQRRASRASDLDGSFQPVRSTAGMVTLESNAMHYTSRAADKVMDLVEILSPRTWETVTDNHPYRKHYVYLCPTAEVASRMPQLCSIYAITYYLGSITRYRPHQFQGILDGDYGPFVEAFLNDQPNQFLYLIASEFVEREVARAALA